MHVAAATQPAWFTFAVIGITAVTGMVSMIASLINAFFQWDRLRQLERQQQRHHQELLAAVREQHPK